MNGNGCVGIFLLTGGVLLTCMTAANIVQSLKSEEISASVVDMEPSGDDFFQTTFRYTDASGAEQEESFLTSAGDDRYYIGGEVTVKLTENGISPAGNSDIAVWGGLGAVGLAMIAGGAYIFIRRDSIVLPSSSDD